MMVWVLIWGTVPPILVGWWSYRQGLRGRKEALKLRDQAIEQVKELHGSIDEFENRLQLKLGGFENRVKRKLEDLESRKIELPSEQVEELKTSITASIKGTFGNLIRHSKNAVGDELELMEKEVEAQMDPAQRVQRALLDKVMSFFS